MLTDEDKKWIMHLIKNSAVFPISNMQDLKDSVFVALEDSLKNYINFQLDSKLILEVLGIKRDKFLNQNFNDELRSRIEVMLDTRLPKALQKYMDTKVGTYKNAIDKYIDGLIEDWTKDKLVPVIEKKLTEVIKKTKFNVNISSSDTEDWDD